MTQPLSADRRVLRSDEIQRRTGYSHMQLRRLERAGRFPRRFKLSPAGGKGGAVGWDSLEFERWLEDRLRSHETQTAHEPQAA